MYIHQNRNNIQKLSVIEKKYCYEIDKTGNATNILDFPCTPTQLELPIVEIKTLDHTLRLTNTSIVSIPTTPTSMIISPEVITSTPKLNYNNSKMREVNKIIKNNDQTLKIPRIPKKIGILKIE